MLIELHIALAIAALVIVPLHILMLDLFTYGEQFEYKRQALFADQAALEENPVVQFVTPCIKSATSEAFYTLTSDPLHARALGKDCHGTKIIENWPTTVTHSLSFDSPVRATSLDARGSLAVVGSTSETIEQADITLINIEKPDNPAIVGSINIGSGVNDIDMIENYIFAVVEGPEFQFQIIDIHHPSRPSLVARISLPGVAGSYPSGLSIFYYDQKVYLGTHRTAGHEFHIFDVANPAAPAWLGSIELNHNINDISVSDGLAYLGTSGNIRDIIVLDISNPASPQKRTMFSLDGNEDTLCIFVRSHELFAGRKKSAQSENAEFVLLNIQEPDNLTVIGSYDMPAAVNGIVAIGRYAYLATGDPAQSLIVLDISDVKNIKKIYSASFLETAADIDYEHGQVITAGFMNTHLNIIWQK